MAKPGFRALVGSKTGSLGPEPAGGFDRDPRAAFARISRKLSAIVAGLKDVAPEAMLYAMEPTFKASQKEVPVDTMDLRSSGYMVLGGSKSAPVVEIGYAKGGKPRYAVIVHEDMEAQHARPTKAKFLEDPINRDLDKYLGRLYEAINNGLSAPPVVGATSFTAAGRRKKKLKRIGPKKRKRKSKFSHGGKRKGAGRPKGSGKKNDTTGYTPNKERRGSSQSAKAAAMKKANQARIKQLLKRKGR